MFSPDRQMEWGNWIDLRTEASLLTVSTLKMGPANLQESWRNAPNLDQERIEYCTRTGSDASKTRPVSEHSYVPSPSSCTLKHKESVMSLVSYGEAAAETQRHTYCNRPFEVLRGVTSSLPWVCEKDVVCL